MIEHGLPAWQEYLTEKRSLKAQHAGFNGSDLTLHPVSQDRIDRDVALLECLLLVLLLRAAGAVGPSEDVTVGEGGDGGADTGGDGTAGGTSSFGTLCVATGGAPGVGSSSRQASDGRSTGPAAEGGTGTGTGGTSEADIVVPGAPGQIGSIFGVALTGFSGAGADSAMGAGGKQATEGNPGNAGQGYGSAGSGGCSNSSTGRPGGAGAPGIVIVTEWS